MLDGQGEGTGAGVENKEGAKVVTSLKGSMGERINKALAKVEDKKRKRQVRRQQVQPHQSSKHNLDNVTTTFFILHVQYECLCM